MRTFKSKLVGIILATVLITALLFSYVFISSSTEGNPLTVIEEGSMVETASYIIFTNGTHYKAKNGTTGTIDYSGTDNSVITNAIQSTQNRGGGIIHFAEGEFPAFSYVNIENITIEGEGMATIFKTSNNEPVLNFSRTTEIRNDLAIRDLAIFGGGYAQSNAHGIVLNSMWHGFIQNVRISNCRYGIYLHNCHWFSFVDINIGPRLTRGTDYVYIGIYGDGTSQGELCWFKRVFIWKTQSHGIWIRYANGLQMQDIQVGYSEGYGVYIGDIAGSIILDNVQCDQTKNDAFHIVRTTTGADWVHLNHIWANPHSTEGTGYGLYLNGAKKVRVVAGEIWGMKNHAVYLNDTAFVYFIGTHIVANQGSGVTDKHAVWVSYSGEIQFTTNCIESGNIAPDVSAFNGSNNWGKVNLVFPYISGNFQGGLDGTYPQNYGEFKLFSMYTYGHMLTILHPNTANWGVYDAGRIWYCTTHDAVEYWNGTHVITLP